MTWRAMCGGPYKRYLHVVAMERHSGAALGRRDTLAALHAHVAAVGNPNPMLLTGAAGTGKSTVLAMLVNELQTSGGSGRAAGSAGAGPSGGSEDPAAAAAAAPEPFILAHTFGLCGQSDDFRRVLLRLCTELKLRFNIYVELPATLAAVGAALPRFLQHAALFGKVVLILDGLERAEMHGVTMEEWLPPSLPLACRVIVAATRCRAVTAMRERSGGGSGGGGGEGGGGGGGGLLAEVAMPPLTGEERRGIVKHALGTVGGGSLSVGALAPLLEADDAGSPMYLLLAVQEIKARVAEEQDVHGRGGTLLQCSA